MYFLYDILAEKHREGENSMTTKQATAEVFLTAFRALRRQEQNAFLFTIIKDHSFREDIIDLAIAVKRSTEKCKKLHAFVRTLKRDRKN